MTTYIGIDNNPSGAVSHLLPDGTATVADMPTYSLGGKDYVDAAGLWETHIRPHMPDAMVIFEQGQKNPLFGTKGNYTNGASFAAVHAMLRLMKVRHQLVNPKTWQKVMFRDVSMGTAPKLKKDSKATKDASVYVCKNLFPQINLVPPRCRNENDNWSDALLIAEYARRGQL
jgi:hypothetical protein